MRKLQQYLFTVCLLLLTSGLWACQDELDDIVIHVSPDAGTVTNIYAGEKAMFKIKVRAEKSDVSNLKVTSFDSQNGTLTLLDSICNQKSIDCSFVYTASEMSRSKTEVKLNFEASDNEGNKTQAYRTINVHNRSITIAEQTGIILYSPDSGLPDALILSDVSRPFVLSETARPDTADIYIAIDPETQAINMRSNTETKFIRQNNFNYSNASAATITGAYAASIPTDFISDLRVNDIIIVGHSTSAEGVFHVIDIKYENNQPNNIRLNYKGLSAKK